MIPGSNLLKMALTLIAPQTIIYLRAIDRTLNAIGQNVTHYAAPREIMGSFQAVPRTMYELYGLDLQKSYYMFYTSNNLTDLQRNVSGDQIVFQNIRYQCESGDPWFGVDGWVGILCVQVEDIPYQETLFGFGTTPASNTYFNFTNGTFAKLENT